jgi:sugar-specific transcriptional regulator TrmB
MLYYVLRGLAEKGLVSTKKRKWKTVYIAESPEKLYDLLATREREFNRERDALTKLIPTLKHRYLLSGKRPTVRMFDGIEEYKKALDDSLVSLPNEILSFERLGAQKPAHAVRRVHEQKRMTRKVKRKVVFFEDEESLKILSKRPYDDYTEFRGIAKGSVTPFETDLDLYEGKILYTSYYDEQEPAAILIEDHALYLMQKSFFDLLWQNGKDRTLMCAKQ